MVWAAMNSLSARIRFVTPVMEFFHPYKKLLEDTWRLPEFYYTFFAPLEHSFHQNSCVYPKPKLKRLESYFTALRLAWPEFRTRFLVLGDILTGKARKHMRNVLLIFEFFIPVVSFVRSTCLLLK